MGDRTPFFCFLHLLRRIIGSFGLVGIVPLPLMSYWCTTWLAFTRHGGFGVVGSVDSFLIVGHDIRLLCVRSVEVMTTFQLFFFSSVVVVSTHSPDH